MPYTQIVSRYMSLTIYIVISSSITIGCAFSAFIITSHYSGYISVIGFIVSLLIVLIGFGIILKFAKERISYGVEENYA